MKRDTVVSIYAWTVAALGAALLLAQSFASPGFLADLPWIVLFILLCTGLEFVAVPLTSGVWITFDFVLVFFVYIRFGYLAAAWTASLGTVVGQIFRKRPARRVAFIPAQFVLSVFAMDWVFRSVSGISHVASGGLPLSILPVLFLAAFVYSLVNNIFVPLYVALEKPQSLKGILATIFYDLATVLFLALLTILGAAVFDEAGWVGLLVYLIPFPFIVWSLFTLVGSASISEELVRRGKTVSLSSVTEAVEMLILIFCLGVLVTVLYFVRQWTPNLFFTIGGLAVTGLFLVGAFLMRAFVRKRIALPTSRVVAQLRDMARGSGDLSVRIPITTRDEIGELASSMNEFVDRMAMIVRDVKDQAERMASSAEELASSAQEMSATAEEIASTAEETSRGARAQVDGVKQAIGAVDVIEKTVGEVSGRAETGTHLAQEVAKRAGEGGESVQEMVSHFALIEEAVRNLAVMIEGQARHTAEITKITHLITTISTKTNLLSLNAAIEAARAGEQGKSFAVVAEEIKTLAQGSQNSAKEIGSLIEAIEEETRKVRASMQAGQERVGGGREVVEQARSRLLEIVSLAADTAKASLENYESFQREKEEVASIVKAMQAISKVTDETAVRMEEATAATQQSTATSQEVAKTAQEVARTAEELKMLVRKFKV